MAFEQILIAIHVVAAIAIVGLVLLQRGKGAEMGASFGSGASQTMFGSMGSGNFLTKSTSLMTVVFFATSLGLAIIASDRAERAVQDGSLLSGDIEQTIPQPTQNQQSGDLPVVGGESGGDDLPQTPTE